MCVYIYIYIYIYKSISIYISLTLSLSTSLSLSLSIYVYIYIYTYIPRGTRPHSPRRAARGRTPWVFHTRHILPPSEIDGGLFLADFAGSEGKHLFHRIG